MNELPPLKPCPFCGSHAETDFIPREMSYLIECHDCEARGSRCDNAADAVASWNRRAQVAAPDPVAWRYRYGATEAWKFAAGPASQWALYGGTYQEEPLYLAPPSPPVAPPDAMEKT